MVLNDRASTIEHICTRVRIVLEAGLNMHEDKGIMVKEAAGLVNRDLLHIAERCEQTNMGGIYHGY
jgi:hypothetical protein